MPTVGHSTSLSFDTEKEAKNTLILNSYRYDVNCVELSHLVSKRKRGRDRQRESERARERERDRKKERKKERERENVWVVET